MEIEVVRRRINKIAGHFVAPTSNDIVSSTTHLLPMNCNSSLNSVFRRCDNRLYFARQASASQACFMRQSSSEQTPPRNASEAPLFARPSILTHESSYDAYEAPLFSRPARMEPNNANSPLLQHRVPDCKLSTAVSDLPKFAKPHRRIGKKEQFLSKKKTSSSKSMVSGQACHFRICTTIKCQAVAENVIVVPKNSVVPKNGYKELGCNYVMTIEIPGVGINDIRVEIDDKNLRVMAKHSAKSSVSGYHRREYREGPYQVIWSLPTDANKDAVSADFLDGLLQIIIPKL